MQDSRTPAPPTAPTRVCGHAHPCTHIHTQPHRSGRCHWCGLPPCLQSRKGPGIREAPRTSKVRPLWVSYGTCHRTMGSRAQACLELPRKCPARCLAHSGCPAAGLCYGNHQANWGGTQGSLSEAYPVSPIGPHTPRSLQPLLPGDCDRGGRSEGGRGWPPGNGIQWGPKGGGDTRGPCTKLLQQIISMIFKKQSWLQTLYVAGPHF